MCFSLGNSITYVNPVLSTEFKCRMGSHFVIYDGLNKKYFCGGVPIMFKLI